MASAKAKKVMLGRKAQLEWIFFTTMFFLVIAALIPVGGAFVRSVAASMNQSSSPLDDQSKDIVNAAANNYDGLWDNMFFFIYVGVWLALLIAFYFVQEHPAFAIVMIIFLVLFLTLAPIVSNIFAGFSSNSILEVTRYAKTKYIMDNYLTFAILMALSCMGVLYAKGRAG